MQQLLCFLHDGGVDSALLAVFLDGQCLAVAGIRCGGRCVLLDQGADKGELLSDGCVLLGNRFWGRVGHGCEELHERC